MVFYISFLKEINSTMKTLSKYSKFIPYLYFISVVIYWFTHVNKSEGLAAYPILLFGIPFLWQLIRPNQKLNFTLGITFVCISSYLILAYLSDVFDIISFTNKASSYIIYGGLFVSVNFIMALWIIRNSLKRSC